MIVTINSIENNSGLGLGVFSREGRMINSKFNEFQQSIYTEEEEDEREVDDEGQPQTTNLITLKMVAHKRDKTKDLMKHPLAGHFNKSQLRTPYEGRSRETLLERLRIKNSNPDYIEKGNGFWYEFILYYQNKLTNFNRNLIII